MRIVRIIVVATLVAAMTFGDLAVATPTGAATAAAQVRPRPPQPPALSDTEVARLFDAPLPALTDPERLPVITGNAAADRRIVRLATDRGYRPRGEPLEPLGWYQGRQLHQQAIDDLVALQAAMRAEVGVSLSLTSAYRSPSTQRSMFLRRLPSASAIAAGRADGAVDAALRWVAPPGFSKHQTGYAIDVASGGVGGLAFASTTAYRWLSADRYANAMRFGWIPSYPPDAVDQGPNPEPWEWVWIGRTAAACARSRACPIGDVTVTTTTGRRVRLDGWAVSSESLWPRLRLVTAAGPQVVGVRRVDRFDVADVFGTELNRVGFSARARLAPSARWFCIEVRPRDGRWQRLTCRTR
ncbi:MAG: D-alanyl-D-alanine carboxypeptidase family protein [Acidimicrobiales bacterium]